MGIAARGGLVDKKYSWGDDESVARDYANYNEIDGKDKWDKTAPAGSFKLNIYGLYDMAGNVYEWCQDWFLVDVKQKVLRGGYWNSDSNYLRLARRVYYDPDDWNGIGFRCVLGSN